MNQHAPDANNPHDPRHDAPELRLQPLDPALRRLESDLDLLARLERDAAGPGFEDRVLAAVTAPPAPLRLAPAGLRAWPVRLAACLALGASAILAYVALRSPPTTGPVAAAPAPSLDDAAGELLAVAALEGDDHDAFAAEMDALLADAERVSEGLRSDPGLGSTPGSGAM